MRRTSPARPALVASVACVGVALSAAAPQAATAGVPDRRHCAALSPATAPAGGQRQADFTAAARQYGVPRGVLLAVGYLQARWDSHGSSPSTSGGYGVMHLTDADLPNQSLARGDGVALDLGEPAGLHTLQLATRLTGLPAARLKTDPAANVCGGAALLAHYQRQLGGPLGAGTDPGAWYGAVARYSGAADEGTARRFAGQVYSVLRSGAHRTTNDGQRVVLAPHRLVEPRRAQLRALGLQPEPRANLAQCPSGLGCRWIPAPYEQYGSRPSQYGNHDLADRPRDMHIDYIVIHDTEGYWRTALSLVQDPTYVSWHYTLRSSDGQVAQHVRHDDVAWQAGNWYVNMHSIGLEHEGFAASGATWFTEALYRSSARLVRYLTKRYDIPRTRAHVIGHDQIPGPAPEYVRGMHWDPGPYWDWQHYFRLLKAPIGRPVTDPGNRVRTIVPGFAANRPRVTGCTSPGQPCRRQGANFVYLRTRPSFDAPLVGDAGLHPDGGPSTTEVWDTGARAVAGHKLRVTGRQAPWTRVWYLGAPAWFYDPAGNRNSVRSNGALVTPKPGRKSIPVYGRAYPGPAAYEGTEIPVQEVEPLQYRIRAGQSYVVGLRRLQTDYYYAVSYDDSRPDDHTQVKGADRYYGIWFGHRLAYVRAADVVLTPAR